MLWDSCPFRGLSLLFQLAQGFSCLCIFYLTLTVSVRLLIFSTWETPCNIIQGCLDLPPPLPGPEAADATGERLSLFPRRSQLGPTLGKDLLFVQPSHAS